MNPLGVPVASCLDFLEFLLANASVIWKIHIPASLCAQGFFFFMMTFFLFSSADFSQRPAVVALI